MPHQSAMQKVRSASRRRQRGSLKFRAASLITRMALWVTGIWLTFEVSLAAIHAISPSKEDAGIEGAGIGAAIGGFLTALIAWAGEFSIRKLEEYFVHFLPDWSAVEQTIDKMLDEIEKDPRSEFWFAAYWLGFGADAHDWDFAKAPVPLKIENRLREPASVMGKTHLLLLHPNDKDGEDDLAEFIKALISRRKSENCKDSPTPEGLLKKYREHLARVVEGSFTVPFKKGISAKTVVTLDSGVDGWANRSENPDITLHFRSKELPMLVAYAKSPRGAQAVLLLANRESLATNGPLGGFSTSDQRLTTEIERMLEKLRDSGQPKSNADVTNGEAAPVASAGEGGTDRNGPA